MSDSVVELDGVGKRYLLGEHHGGRSDLRETITGAVRRARTGERSPRQEFWPLRDVSLSVGAGEAVGLIGSNGAGKSTLLKIVSGITAPTEGRSRTRGRVGALLEVGTGFHGELTGVENAYLNGAILGMSRRDVSRRLADIVAFAGIERFVDTPVKRYSSGMYLRLGFSIAAHLDADILVVDEVLAVGDAEFQRQCLGKMSEVEREGRTILFVSHNLDAVSRLCPRTIWLDNGGVRTDGPSDDVVEEYLRSTLPISQRSSFVVDPDMPAQVVAVELLDDDDHQTPALRTGQSGSIVIDVVVNQPVTALDVGVLISTERGVNIIDEAHSDAANAQIGGRGHHRLRCPLPAILTPGDYTVGIWLGTAYETLQHLDRPLKFSVEGDDGGRPDRLVRLGSPWVVETLD